MQKDCLCVCVREREREGGGGERGREEIDVEERRSKINSEERGSDAVQRFMKGKEKLQENKKIP